MPQNSMRSQMTGDQFKGEAKPIGNSKVFRFHGPVVAAKFQMDVVFKDLVEVSAETQASLMNVKATLFVVLNSRKVEAVVVGRSKAARNLHLSARML